MAMVMVAVNLCKLKEAVGFKANVTTGTNNPATSLVITTSWHIFDFPIQAFIAS